MEEQLPPLLNISNKPASEIVQKVMHSGVPEDLELSDITIEAIAGKLHFYQQTEANLPEWRAARKTSSKELAAASTAAMNAVSAIRNNLLRSDNASLYHQDAIEGYARLWKKRTGEYPTTQSKLLSNQGDSQFSAGVSGLIELAKALQLLAASCDAYSEAPSSRLPEFGEKGPVRTEDLKSWLILSLADLLAPYIDTAKDDYIRDLISIVGIDISRKRIQNFLSQG